MIKPRLSDIIEYQAKCQDWLLDLMQKPCCYPLDAEPYSNEEIFALLDKQYIDNEEDKHDAIEHFKNIKTDLERKYLLCEVNIDCPTPLIVLDDKPEEYLMSHYNFTPGQHFILLGEIAQTSGHLVVASMATGATESIIVTMVHDFNFYVARPMDT